MIWFYPFFYLIVDAVRHLGFNCNSWSYNKGNAVIKNCQDSMRFLEIKNKPANISVNIAVSYGDGMCRYH